MENLKSFLELFYSELYNSLQTKKEYKKKLIDLEQDLLSVLVSSSMNSKAYREFIENNGISIAQLRVHLNNNLEIFEDSSVNGYIKKCQLLANKNKYYLTLKGLYMYMKISNSDFDFSQVLEAYESYRMPNQIDLQITRHEKLIVIFLIVVGADCEKNALFLKSPEFDKNCFNLLKMIDAKCIEKEIDLGGKIIWGKGKNIGFKFFLTNNDKLPKTMVFNKINNRFDGYYLDFYTSGNTSLIIDLLTGNLDTLSKYLFKLKLNDLFFELKLIVSDYLEEMTPEINSNLTELLKI